MEALPEASIAEQFTVVVPFGKFEPEAGEQVTVAEPELSVAVTLKFTTAPHWPAVVVVTMFCGQPMTGGIVSSPPSRENS